MIKKISKEKKRLIIGATGASGIPVLQKCLELIKEEEDYESWLVLTKSGERPVSRKASCLWKKSRSWDIIAWNQKKLVQNLQVVLLKPVGCWLFPAL